MSWARAPRAGKEGAEARASGSPEGVAFVRTGTTWLAYLSLGYYSYLINVLGPAMPFLRADLRLSYAQGSLHPSAFAAGMIVAGLGGDRLARAWGRRPTLILGGAGLALGTILLVSGRTLALTLSGALVMGALGTLLLVLVPAILSDAHGEGRATALTEANVVASLCAVLAPLALGAGAATRLGWRAALVLGAVAVVPLARRMRHALLGLPARSAGLGRGDARLPAGYWAYWVVIVCAVSIEFCTIFWAADFLHAVAGLPRSVAAGLVGVFLGGVLLGRVAGSRLTRRLAAVRILPVALAVAAVGFPVYWLVPSTPARVAGLFVAGLGVGPLYPLALALAVGAARGQSATASARASLASGVAILVAPLALGWLADHGGIARASGVVGILLVATLLASRVARRLAVPGLWATSAAPGDLRSMPVGFIEREREV